MSIQFCDIFMRLCKMQFLFYNLDLLLCSYAEACHVLSACSLILEYKFGFVPAIFNSATCVPVIVVGWRCVRKDGRSRKYSAVSGSNRKISASVSVTRSILVSFLLYTCKRDSVSQQRNQFKLQFTT